jgi:hypothetical protein
MPVMEAAAKKLARRSVSVEEAAVAAAAAAPNRRPSLQNGDHDDGDATVARAAAALVSVDIDEGAKPLDFSASENNSPGIITSPSYQIEKKNGKTDENEKYLVFY